jgi:hypothetical protein
MVGEVEDPSASTDGTPWLELIGQSPEGHEHRERRGRRCGCRGCEGELPRELAAGAVGTRVAWMLVMIV